MDCAVFFKELKHEFLSRGMDFRYLPDKFSYGDIRHYPYVIVRDDQDFEVFSGLSDMVYHLALKLANSIGRLPGHLHARMVLSTDEHHAVKKYISRYGS